ncbi:GNAT family N-acetyltransferase [Kiloniella sp. b19]|uniref:GNAT family N-acetyltransferase n=1 Tax=Kiloniella sp. GXU_MW_B19 TaxID=3141326 RepID=UPI0031DB6E01
MSNSTEHNDSPEFGERPQEFVPVTVGPLTICLARDEKDIRASQRLRYDVFYREMSARPDDATAREERDFDRYDDICDHLIVLDDSLGQGADAIVGTYRLLRRSVAENSGGFYTADEFDVSRLLKRSNGLLELGRSCIHADYRRGSTMQLLWQGIAQYVFNHDIQYMFGCASIEGTDPDELALPLSYLAYNHAADASICPEALPNRYVDMKRLARDEIDDRSALRSVPPLIKGYLRLGGTIGEGAVVDEQFGTTDVCVVVETQRVTDKYFKHYTRKAGQIDAQSDVAAE